MSLDEARKTARRKLNALALAVSPEKVCADQADVSFEAVVEISSKLLTK